MTWVLDYDTDIPVLEHPRPSSGAEVKRSDNMNADEPIHVQARLSTAEK